MRWIVLTLLLAEARASLLDGVRQVCGAAGTGSVHRGAEEDGVSNACRLQGGEAAQHTYAMLKPDVASDPGKVAQIKQLIEDAGLNIVREEHAQLTRRQCELFYAEHRERAFFGDLVKFMSSGPVLKLELAGRDAVRRWRALLGPTNSAKARDAAPGSVRALFGSDAQCNAAHGSDGLDSAARELSLMFDAEPESR
mmetsp:Transcript_50466/g.116491  ORF Transcript_50466/g.116491 Transcript_50466/m.116491 type:complete len:196 (-) Transcript_50466:76-663(-)